METDDRDKLYLEINSYDETTRTAKCPVHSVMTIFLASYCDSNSVIIVLVQRDSNDKCMSTNLQALNGYTVQHSIRKDIPEVVQQCSLPALLSSDGRFVRCGLCGVSRCLVQLAQKRRELMCKTLLGFKGMCLKQCAEVSPLTKFCEIELPDLISRLLHNNNWSVSKDIIPILRKFESHLKNPPIIHNINKLRDAAAKNARQQKGLHPDAPIADADLPELQHLFSEGPNMTLSDMLILPCFHYILRNLQDDKQAMSELWDHCPRICEWFERMRGEQGIRRTSSRCGFGEVDALENFRQTKTTTTSELITGIESLNIRVQGAKKVKASRSQVNNILEKLQDAELTVKEDAHPMDGRISLNWDELPQATNPCEGNLPKKRVNRKCEQLENMVAAVRHVARPGHTIVDFCAGGGHVGILLAYLLPDCKVILVENKEESVRRARERISTLKLENIITYQCNMDYFTGDFNIGLCLHACGIATDLVLQNCIDKKADFVICPCCYGGIKDTFQTKYPRSHTFKSSPLTYQEYLVLGHAADQTEVNIPQASQGKQSMLLIDKDRALLAEEYGYHVTLCSLQPLSCSPKNNLIIGTKAHW